MMKISSQSPAHNILLGVSFVLFMLFIGHPANSAEHIIKQWPDPKRQRELIHLLVQDCGSCHGLTLKGGLGPALLPHNLKDKDSEFLAEVILEGVPGTPMPPWNVEITELEAKWLVQRMKEGGIHDN